MIVLVDDESERTRSLPTRPGNPALSTLNKGSGPAIKSAKAYQPLDEAVDFEF